MRERLGEAGLPVLGAAGAMAVCCTVHLIVLAGGFGVLAAAAGRWWPAAAVIAALPPRWSRAYGPSGGAAARWPTAATRGRIRPAPGRTMRRSSAVTRPYHADSARPTRPAGPGSARLIPQAALTKGRCGRTPT